jgi:hypothetical protein
VCIDTFVGGSEGRPWAIAHFRQDACSLIENLNSCVFHWVSRKANGIAHSLAKFAALIESFYFCNKDSLSPIVKEAYLKDEFYFD